MERSSPLAAMQPHAPSMGHAHWNFGSMGPPTMSSAGSGSFGRGSFDFNDISMRQSGTDYFSLRPSRGASPTAHLAVDLSRNFHIDRSPLPPTPRRSLFSTNLLGAINRRDKAITPPPPSSPPCPATTDSMDISPLPHKAPYATTIQVQSPTPESTPNVSMLSSPAFIPESPIEAAMAPAPTERRRLSGSRPSLTRTKGLTTTALFTKSNLDITEQPFRFGQASGLQPSSMLSLDECFSDSPEEMAFPSPLPAAMAPPPRPKSAYQKPNLVAQNSGSPGVRKSNAPYQRPRKQFRRSLSMFEHPADVLNQQKQDTRPVCGLQAIADADDGAPLHLPHFLPYQETIPRITKETMIDVLDGKFREHFDDLMIVDCRFEYEYKGGHIDGAVNFTNKEELSSNLFASAVPPNTLLIFHCEYSAHRAPIAARYIRSDDRSVNAHRYPRLTYPNVYILDGGYSAFFANHKARCYPQSYVEMSDASHAVACERGLGRMRQARGKLSRAQTFAFGQHNGGGLDESPTAPAATQRGKCADLLMAMDISPVRSSTSSQPPARRMCSF